LSRKESEEGGSWQKLVDDIRASIRSGEFEKVVAARRVTLELSGEPQLSAIIDRFNSDAPRCARFALRIGERTFIGATPERLVRKDGSRVATEALAGSIDSRTPDAAKKLQASTKDQHEHAYVVAAIRSALTPLCDSLHIHPEPEVRVLRHLMHLRTPVRGHLREDVHILDLVERLHPTPAVGGLPREEAVRFIDTHERAERGWYAAPMGWVDARGDGEFVVALRSGLICRDKVHLYAGAGIVAESNAEAEFAETELKLSGMLGALGITH
jgi:isochorismate synthase